MDNELDLQILVSTLNDGIYNIKILSSFNYVVVHQITNNEKYDEYIEKNFSSNVLYIEMKGIKGLSKSRNRAIRESTSRYLWIMDDDVEIYSDAKEKILELVYNYKADLFLLGHNNVNKTTKIKIYSYYLKKIQCGCVSSIDMLIDTKNFGKKVFFDENFGLGTNNPSGEEFIFSCDLIKSGGKIYRSSLITALHPEYESGFDFLSEKKLIITKKKMFIRAFGEKVGNTMFVIFFIKKLPVILKKRAFKNFISVIFYRK